MYYVEIFIKIDQNVPQNSLKYRFCVTRRDFTSIEFYLEGGAGIESVEILKF